MKALLISDLHGDQKLLRFLPKIVNDYDIILCAGDLTNFGQPEGYAELIDEIMIDKTCFWVSGNNDTQQEYQYRLKNMQNIDGKIVEYRGHKFAGLGGSYQNYEAQNFGPSLIGKDSDLSGCVLLSHIPPSLKLKYSPVDIVCHSRLRRANPLINNAPSAHICGHLHDTAGVACIGSTKVIKLAPAKFGEYAEMDLDNLQVDFKKVK